MLAIRYGRVSKRFPQNSGKRVICAKLLDLMTDGLRADGGRNLTS